MSQPLTRTLLIAPLLVAFATGSSAIAVASSDTPRDPAISEGVLLHDAGEYDKAIAKYREALAREPGNVTALYEMALSHYAKKDLAAALEAAEAGIRFADPLWPALYVLIGNVRDEGDSAGAIAAYRAGIKEDPKVAQLHLNLGVTLFRQKKWKAARLSFQQAVVLATRPHTTTWPMHTRTRASRYPPFSRSHDFSCWNRDQTAPRRLCARWIASSKTVTSASRVAA
jgi:tetratricopeptide (TPR) repeat protein